MSETFRKGGPRKEVAAAERGSSTTVKPASAKLQNMGAFKGVVLIYVLIGDSLNNIIIKKKSGKKVHMSRGYKGSSCCKGFEGCIRSYGAIMAVRITSATLSCQHGGPLGGS